MRAARWAVIAIGLIAAAPALADDAFDTCRGAGGAEKDCGEQWIGREQGRVDAIWREITNLTEGKVSADLTVEQHAWEAFRDASCAFKLDDGFGEADGYYAQMWRLQQQEHAVQSPLARKLLA